MRSPNPDNMRLTQLWYLVSGLFDMQMLCFMANLALITIVDDHHCLLIYSMVCAFRKSMQIIVTLHLSVARSAETSTCSASTRNCPMRANQKQLEPKTVVTKQFYKWLKRYRNHFERSRSPGCTATDTNVSIARAGATIYAQFTPQTMPEPARRLALSLSLSVRPYGGEDNCVFLQLNNKFAHQMPRRRREGGARTVTTLSCTKKVKLEPNFWPGSAAYCHLEHSGPVDRAKLLNKVANGSPSLSACSQARALPLRAQSKYLNLLPETETEPHKGPQLDLGVC